MARKKNIKLTWKITESLIEYFDKHGEFPSISELSRINGVKRDTIRNHLNKGGFHEYVLPALRYNTLHILAGLARKASDGDAPAAKLWLQFVEGWKETQKIEQKNEVDEETWAKMETVFGIK